MNTFKLSESGSIQSAFFDKNLEDGSEDKNVWYEAKNGALHKTDRRVVMLASGKLVFADEISQSEIEEAAAQLFQREAWDSLRSKRNKRLLETDYMMLPDAGLSDEQTTMLRIYRQALRDLTKQDGAPWDGGPGIPWPDLPF